jgi:type VI secretion system ImpB/VipA family protein
VPTKLSSFSFDLNVAPDRKSQGTEEDPDPQRRVNLVVMGDFTGRASRDVIERLSTRKLLNVDVDNFARSFAQLGAKLKLTGAEIPDGMVELGFASTDDFHPDCLLTRVPLLARLVEARRLLLNPTTAEQGRTALEACLGTINAPAESFASTAEPKSESTDQTMARLLGGALPEKKSAPPTSQLDQFIKQVIAPHISAAPKAWQSGAAAAAEMELTNRLNAILHHADFQELEVAWRGVELLVRRIESSEEIGLLVLDASFAELHADLAAQDQAEQSALFRLLRDAEPKLIVGNYTFGQTADGLRTLGKLAEIAAGLSAPFVATAASQLVGCDSFAAYPDPDDWKQKLPADVSEIWDSLRRSPHAIYVGLAAPRFLLRQPYGKAGDPIETFAFEELPGQPVHEAFLWGHPGLLCACTAIDAIQSGDMELLNFTGGEFGDLPVHRFTEGGEKAVQPYAEAWLTDRAADRLVQHGVIPIIGAKNENVIRLNHLCSIANGPVALRMAC